MHCDGLDGSGRRHVLNPVLYPLPAQLPEALLHAWFRPAHTGHPAPPLRSADAQQRYVSKQQAFGGAGTASAAVGGESNWQSSWQRQLCDARLAALPPYAHPLGGTCPLTSRKVEMCRRGRRREEGLGWGSALAGLGIGLAGRALTAVL